MLNILRQNMLETSSDLTQYLQQNTDARLQEVQKYSATLELNQINSHLKRINAPVSNITQDMYRFSDQMNSYKIANKIVSGVFIYYPDLQLIVGDLGCYYANSYYALHNQLATDGLDKWLSAIQQTANGFALLPEFDGQSFSYIRQMICDGRVAGYIIFQFDTVELLKAIEPLLADSSTQVAFGISLDDQIFAQIGDGDLLSRLLLKQESNDAILYQRSSELPSIQYVNVYMQRELLRPFSIALYLCVFGVVFCALFGVLASVYIGRRHTVPLHSLMTKLGAEVSEAQDEYQAIGQQIDRMLQERNLSVEKLQAQQNMIGGLFLNTVLAGSMHNEYAIFNAAKRYDVMFEQPYYLVAVVHLSPAIPEQLGGQLLDWFSQLGYDVIVSYFQDNYVLLLNLAEEVYQHSMVPVFKQLLQQVFPDGGATAALGMRYDSLVHIPASYSQALSALGEDADDTVGNVICYSNRLETSAEKDMMNISSSEAFATDLQQGRYTLAMQSLELLLSQHTDSEMSAELRNIQFAAIQNLLLTALRKARLAGDISPEAYRTREIVGCQTPVQLRAAAHSLMNKLCGDTTDDCQEGGSIAERAKTIINRDFTDPMLGLYLVSDELKVSNSYLSTTFKSKYGIGLVQYINQLRINQAKLLIQSTSMSIKEIALMVGFSSDISFIRVFKKYESRTPSSLRKHG